MRFRTGLEPLLEKLAMGEQMPLPLPGPATPGLLARGGRMLGQAASRGYGAAQRAFGALPGAAKAGLGTAALLGAGGLAYGAMHQHENDTQKNRQVYTPMTGSIYG